MNKDTLKEIIQNFSPERFIDFFHSKNRFRFRPFTEQVPHYNDDNFTDALFIGEIPFDNVNKLSTYAFRVTKALTERSGKKAQYEKGKRILRETNSNAGIFIFYDNNSNFRFSLIYPEYTGQQRQWSSFKRFTYFVSPSFTNKTFLKQIGEGDFSSIEAIKQAFSVEKVTKEFYTSIANWYFWAIKHARFPEDAEKLDNGRNIAIIRLITRIIFIWFMKVRGLVPDALFDKEEIKEILADVSANESTYYKAILQNLFFATLNTRQEERKFRNETRGYKGYNPDYGNHNVYRYQKLFKHPEAMEQYFAKIPFLNGGLFECLDYKSKTKQDRVYIDGFTDVEKYQPNVPNFLFFSDEKKIDLNKEFGTNNKSYKVLGLLDILSSYNFTIDENEPDDAEVALDPELLGIVFENLLASYNPETATTARKATGSYYTPRPIVDYMVTQSLIQYFKAHLSDEIETKLSQLFSRDHSENPCDEATTNKLIALIEQLRVVDPAVGSGAFPMSILNKLVLLLSKLDPNNTLWKQRQIDAVKQNIKDPVVQNKLIEQIEKQFRDKNADYGRKLYLIEKCIYGVDIQQIAVEIAKLRFFISLLVDEKIDPDKPNYGIEPLPNLDFKLMQGNSLIASFAGIDFDKLTTKETKTGQATIGFENRYNRLISQFEEVKNQFQNEPNKEAKDGLREKIEGLLIQIFEEKLREHFPQLKAIQEKAESLANEKQRAEYIASEKQSLSKKLGFDLEQVEKELIAYTEGKKPKDFFLWDIYFAEVFNEKGGFDIVIANPPYGFRNVLSVEKKKYFRKERNIKFPSGDIAELFILIGYNNMVNLNGIQTFIIPKKSLYGESWINIRKLWISNKLLYLVDDSKAFKNVLLEQTSFSLMKSSKLNKAITIGALDQENNQIRIFGNFLLEEIFTEDLRNAQIYRGLYKDLLKKVFSNSILDTSKYIHGEIGISNITGNLTLNPDGNYPCVKGIDIIKYGLRQERYLKGSIAKKYLSQYSGDKIVAQKIVAHVQNPFPHIIITMFYDDKNRLIHDTCVEVKVTDTKLYKKFILAYFQSTFCNWYAYNLIYNRAIRTMDFINYYITQIPIPKLIIEEPIQQNPFTELADQILAITKDEDYLHNPIKQAKVKELEKEIDRLVYKLYDLTPEEIAMVEGKR
ncbi:MAG: hypothetical protein M1381_11505 [Deltaproteobacteria bacterium]|nr:hypothetical protein [Deltaproteobacteria bacterium]MCL5278099.1 hypothetical protein [Deltaproteobacteria bacterium]